MSVIFFTLLVILVMVLPIEGQIGGLKIGFYLSSCPSTEHIVRSTVEAHFKKDPTIAPALLRLHFHDCFIRGCDGSVLIKGNFTEMTSLPNGGLRGFEIVDDAKAQIETMCPGVVSCADILALSARDAVNLVGGPSWEVPLGRRDGNVSSTNEAFGGLPLPFQTIDVHKKMFADRDLDDYDFVTLLGAHTIGQAHCSNIQERLYNYTKRGDADPTINSSFLPKLRSLCPPNVDKSKTVPLDNDTPLEFDVNFYKDVSNGYGVIESDQRLWGDDTTKNIVQKYAENVGGSLGLRFDIEFPKSMIKMSGIEVKTGDQGEIRKICSKFN